MTRIMTIKEYLLEELNRRLRERGEDIELVYSHDRPKPQLAAQEGKVVQLKEQQNES